MFFKGEYAFLSNFYPSPILFGYYRYPTVENAYQACKSINKEDWYRFQLMSPAHAKRAGFRVVLRPGWNEMKLSIMTELVTLKFQDPELAMRLIGTDSEEIIEENTWGDTYWGKSNGIGLNNLGKILMNIRSSLNTVEEKVEKS